MSRSSSSSSSRSSWSGSERSVRKVAPRIYSDTDDSDLEDAEVQVVNNNLIITTYLSVLCSPARVQLNLELFLFLQFYVSKQ